MSLKPNARYPVPEETLRRVWAEQFVTVDNQLVWRDPKTLPSPADLVASPYDTDARYRTKRHTDWVGYKVHLTETCDADKPHLIVNVATTPATTPDDNMAAIIHNDLAVRDRLPGEHLLDKGYVNTAAILTDQQVHHITLIGPVSDPPNGIVKLINMRCNFLTRERLSLLTGTRHLLPSFKCLSK